MNTERYDFEPGETIPNHPRWPLLIVRGAWPSADEGGLDPGRIEVTYRQNGWGGTWRNGIYGFHHYHSNVHEVLGIARGTARVRFGGSQGKTVALSAGDAAVLPAGTGHKKESASADLLVVGAYPEGQTNWDLLRENELGIDEALQRILDVPRPDSDPIAGPDGPMTNHWPE